jgi:hypothetical protein
MPTRKQRRRAQKERRHEYETVWVDSEGNELDEPPEDYGEPAPREKRDDRKSTPKSGRPQRPQRPQRGGRPIKAPLPPSWRRATKRSLILGVVIVALFYLVNSKAKGNHRLESALVIGVLYTALFVPFQYAIDRFAYRRWQAKFGPSGAKKR